jgi:hypothetical protein
MSARQAAHHERSRTELELLLDSKNEDDLHEAFDTFLDLLLECLIREKAINRPLKKSFCEGLEV